tara:strand:- start:27550 stop:27951 length:402 start_codon:yes stop_codon:yes gene_type:complete
MYDFKIWERGRKRDVIYARKVWCQLAHKMGFGPTAMMRAVNNNAFKHDIMLHHKKTFSVVNTIDLHHYNACIDYFNLPVNKINSINELIYGAELTEVIKDLSELSRKDLKYFREDWIPKFKKKLEMEEKLNKM